MTQSYSRKLVNLRSFYFKKNRIHENEHERRKFINSHLGVARESIAWENVKNTEVFIFFSKRDRFRSYFKHARIIYSVSLVKKVGERQREKERGKVCGICGGRREIQVICADNQLSSLLEHTISVFLRNPLLRFHCGERLVMGRKLSFIVFFQC